MPLKTKQKRKQKNKPQIRIHFGPKYFQGNCAKYLSIIIIYNLKTN